MIGRYGPASGECCTIMPLELWMTKGELTNTSPSRRLRMTETAGRRPLRIINGVAPIRICDNGGWTDTWFAKTGKIFNIGVYPYVEVQVEVFHRGDQPQQVVVFAE